MKFFAIINDKGEVVAIYQSGRLIEVKSVEITQLEYETLAEQLLGLLGKGHREFDA